MRILLTGANGYIGTRLLFKLVEQGHEVVAVARRPNSVKFPQKYKKQVTVISGDLLQRESLAAIPKNIDAAYYLVHSMGRRYEDFERLDKKAAENFVSLIGQTLCQQIIYLTGLISDKASLSRHLSSRFEVENILRTAKAPLTALRAGIIIGSGSASFEIIRDLVEKLPIMVAPKWIRSKCQPIAIPDVLFYLTSVLKNKECLGQTFDIGGPDVLSYKEMLEGYAKQRKLFRLIITVPVLTPRLSSYWLILITATNYYLARALIESVKNDAVCHDHRIIKVLSHRCLTYQEALDRTFEKIESDSVISTWKDSWSSSGHTEISAEDFAVPRNGCLSMGARVSFKKNPDAVFEEILKLGDSKGWCFMNWAWRIRGLIDLLLGGVGLRKGRRSKKKLKVGDVIDFWRVLHVSKEERKLVLLAEMKLPGEAWLEFTITSKNDRHELKQNAIFHPRGVFGRIYWYSFYPIHLILFPGMLRRLVKGVL